jgi:hypothetical protein
MIPVIRMKALIDVFFQPGKLFASLPERRAAWVLPLLINVVLLLASTAFTINMLGMDLIMRQRLASSTMSADQMQKAMAQGTSPAAVYITYAAVLFFSPIFMLIVSGMLFAFGMMTSRAPKFGSMLAMVNLAFFPYILITAVMTALVIVAAPDKTALDVNNLLATNVAAFVSKSQTSKGLYALYGSLDILSFMELGLMSYGFSKLTKAGLAAGFGAVGGMWILFVFSKMALSLFQ